MESIRSEILRSLPDSIEWPNEGHSSTIWNFRFADSTMPKANKKSLPNCDLKPEWEGLRLFGHSDSDTWFFYLCVDPTTGQIFGLDPEKYSERGELDKFAISSSIEEFSKIFQLLNPDLSNGIQPSRETITQINEIADTEAFASWWNGWIA